MAESWDAIVVGSGPNGLAAAIALAQAGRSVKVLEAAATIGGGTRTAELTLPGFRHDVCSAIHPTAVVSPFFKTLPLAKHVSFQPSYIWENNRVPGLRDVNYLQFGLIVSTR